MPVAGDLIALLALADAVRLPMDEVTPESMRAGYSALASPGGAEMAEVVDRVIPGPDGGDLPIRSYRPLGAAERPPVIVYLHGGGWTIGDLETHDEPCRALAAGTGAVVISVDYRLAPEHRFPDALDDAYAAVCFIADNADELGVDVERLVVAGDSAGGNLAAVVSLMARDRSGPAIALQVLIYPAVDFDYDSGRWPSLEENATGYFLHLETMRWFADCYGDIGQLAGDPLAAPIGAADHAGLPPAHVSVAGFDPLRDEGLGYAATLAGAGVPVTLCRHDDQVHGYWHFAPAVESSGAARDTDIAAIAVAMADLAGPAS
jgi:acetyl esterase